MIHGFFGIGVTGGGILFKLSRVVKNVYYVLDLIRSMEFDENVELITTNKASKRVVKRRSKLLVFRSNYARSIDLSCFARTCTTGRSSVLDNYSHAKLIAI